MQTMNEIAELRGHLEHERAAGATVGLVPTMGFLHDGHQALIRAAAESCDVVVTTVFVNPLQFGPDEDLDRYPRDIEGDSARARAVGCTVLFVPDEAEMYPGGRDAVATSVAVPSLASVMEGATRPSHFGGVCTVVAKIFNIVGPCRAYFGEKDYQQLVILSRMAADLSFPVEVIGCPTARAEDGLALSSRNAYLSPEERLVAPVLKRALNHGASMVANGERDADSVRAAMAEIIQEAPLGQLDYVEVADPHTLVALTECSEDARLFGAVRFGRARLIDNVGVNDAEDGSPVRE